MSNAVAIQHKHEIIEQVRNGVPLQTIAASYGVTSGAISQYLSKDPEYRDARENGAITRLESHYGEIQAAPDALNLARAREAFRAASWFAEREFPAKWAAQTNVTMSVTHHLGDSLMRAEQREREINPAIEQIAQTHVVASANSTVDSYSIDAQVSDSASE